MTAGRGIIHGENVGANGKVRLLQLWLTVPKGDRWTEPGFQTIHTDAVPVRRENGAEVRIYSGGSGSLRSRTRNHVPVTITEITLEPHASIDQEIPSSYNGFVFTLRGSIQAGADNTSLKTGQTGWLERPQVDGASLLRVTAGEEGARLVLYAGQPQGDPIVSYGPFIGDSKRDIARLYTEFQSGQFVSLSELVKAAV
jgi:redox-sensitive bicupin YhaK (pirin superfamily)